jgi:transposase
VEGIARFHELAARHADEPGEVVIGIETDRGLFAAALMAAGYQVFAVNLMSTSRYRDRHAVSGAKSDPGDAKVLADMVRTDRHNHRPAAADSDLAEAVKVLARAHQSMIWSRRRQANMLRSALREFYPAALTAFDDLTSGDAVEVLRAAPAPAQGAALRAPQPQPPEVIAAAMGATVSASVAVIAEMTAQIAVPGRQLAADFEAHPDAEVVRSLPGLGTILGARVLGEFGDAPDRYTSAKSRRNYAGTSPITRASGTRTVVLARHARNKRLADAIYLWAFAAISASPGARAFYDARRAAGDTHHQACAPSATASSASCTAASPAIPPTARSPPGPTAPASQLHALLDTSSRGMSSGRSAADRRAPGGLAREPVPGTQARHWPGRTRAGAAAGTWAPQPPPRDPGAR